MSLSTQSLQFAGSLIAVLFLSWLVRRLSLGAAPILENDADAIETANQVSDNFIPEKVAIDAQGHGALLQDRLGRLIILKPHGSHFAGRLLSPTASAKLVDNGVRIDAGEKRFGTVELIVPDPDYWVDAINALNWP